MSDPKRILVIDDEESICFAFRRYFESRGFAVTVAATGAEGLARYGEVRPDVVFLDVRLGDMSGLDVLERLREQDSQSMIIVITAYGSLETVTRAIRNKAFDYLVKPLDLDHAADLVGQALAQRAAIARGPAAASDETTACDRPQLVGASAPMQEVYKRIGRAALADSTVLILGDTGTGKEMAARAIHNHSPRCDKPFVAVNCGALPESLVESELFGYVRGAFSGADADKPGRFESADGGTLMLDEIGDLPLAVQVKLLRFLDSHTIERLGSVQSKELDVRIIAATNRDLTQAIEVGQFREDLFYRLAVIRITLPPLSQRREDILPLARHFLGQLTPPGEAPPLVSAETAEVLTNYLWPGNVRELRNAIEHAALMSGNGPILPGHLPESLRRPDAQSAARAASDLEKALERYLSLACTDNRNMYQAAMEPLERTLLQRVLQECNGNQSAAAARLGLHRNTLRNKVRQFGLDADNAQ
ncbi:MAG: sigma-54-dependent Fis family transcriptional regulator [Planctomycetes bacterium]|nr:sigma-54-dependent Fis family transcriptional regulator [Planctomycetota bacterium]